MLAEYCEPVSWSPQVVIDFSRYDGYEFSILEAGAHSTCLVGRHILTSLRMMRVAALYSPRRTLEFTLSLRGYGILVR